MENIILKLTIKKSSCSNGFTSQISLIIFGLCVQFAALASVISHQMLLLKQADRQSRLDLKVVERAKEIIEHNQNIRLCQSDKDSLIDYSAEKIYGNSVIFEDKETCMTVKINDKLLYLYYDDTGIQSFEWKQ